MAEHEQMFAGGHGNSKNTFGFIRNTLGKAYHLYQMVVHWIRQLENLHRVARELCVLEKTRGQRNVCEFFGLR